MIINAGFESPTVLPRECALHIAKRLILMSGSGILAAPAIELILQIVINLLPFGMRKIDIEKIQKLSTTEDMFRQEYGPKGTARREEFEAKARAWYYAEVLRDARKAAGMTQQQLADKIGKKREYVALLEKGETDMQLSTFLMISDAVGLKFGLTL